MRVIKTDKHEVVQYSSSCFGVCLRGEGVAVVWECGHHAHYVGLADVCLTHALCLW